MNSNKSYDRLKVAKYFLFANLLVLIAGIVLLCVLGFNVDPNSQHNHILLAGALSVIITLVFVLIYIGIRRSFAKAFSAILIAVHNVLLATALVCIIRIPVAETMIMGYVLLVCFSVIFSLILFDKFENVHSKKDDVNLSIKQTISDGIKSICVFTAIVIVAMLLCLIFESASMMNFAREFFVMAIVLIYSMLTIALPVFCYFSKKIKKRRKAKIDSGVENQKVALATSVEETQVANDPTEKQGE